MPTNRKSPAVAGYVYAIHSPETPNHVKLGLSSNPRSRLRTLQTGNPHKLKLIWTFPCTNMAELEDRLHKVFDKYRIAGGEWFDFRPINDPEHLDAWLTILAYKYLADPKTIPRALRDRLAKVESFIDSPAKFLNSQAATEQIIENQFPDLARYEGDPTAMEAYIERNLRRD
jgi:hypothetical protein